MCQKSRNAPLFILADILLIPIAPSIYDFRAFENFFEKLQNINQNRVAYGGREVQIYILLNKINDKVRVYKAIVDAIKAYDVPILTTQLGNRTAYIETAIEGLGVVEGKDVNVVLGDRKIKAPPCISRAEIEKLA